MGPYYLSSITYVPCLIYFLWQYWWLSIYSFYHEEAELCKREGQTSLFQTQFAVCSLQNLCSKLSHFISETTDCNQIMEEYQFRKVEIWNGFIFSPMNTNTCALLNLYFSASYWKSMTASYPNSISFKTPSGIKTDFYF